MADKLIHHIEEAVINPDYLSILSSDRCWIINISHLRYFVLQRKRLCGGVGVVSTVLSIILSAISLAYTYISGLQTLKTINDIKRQNDALVEEITHERSKDNYDDANSEVTFK